MYGWHDSVSFDLIVPGDSDYRPVCRSRVCTRQREYSARWHHIGCRGARFDADLRVQDAPFVGNAEDELSVVQVVRAYDCALDTNGVGEVPDDLRLTSLFYRSTH